jgi:hypothetical protein
MVQQVVYNTCFGGFGVHENVVKWVRENKSELLERYDSKYVKEIADSTISGEMFSDGSGPKRGNVLHISPRELSRDNELLADIVSERTTSVVGTMVTTPHYKSQKFPMACHGLSTSTMGERPYRNLRRHSCNEYANSISY